MGIFDMFKKEESPFEELYIRLDKNQSWRVDQTLESEILSWGDEKKSLLIIDIATKLNTFEEEYNNWRINRSLNSSCKCNFS